MQSRSVSVIIPCFNCQGTIAETLASIAAQTLAPVEMIAVDDGSSDQTWALLHELKRSRHPSLQILSHPGRQNYGSSISRCLGLAHAAADYIAFLDADDLYAPTKLQQQIAAFERHPEIVMCHTAVRVFGDLDQAAYYETAFSGSPDQPYWLRRQSDYLRRNRICISSSMMRVDALRQIPFSFVGKRGVDDWLCWSLLAGKGKFLYIGEPLTLYRVHPDSITSRLTRPSLATKSEATWWEIRLGKLYAGLEYKFVLLARSDGFLHSLRVFASIAEDLRQIVIAYHWHPGCDPDSQATLPPTLFVRLLSATTATLSSATAALARLSRLLAKP